MSVFINFTFFLNIILKLSVINKYIPEGFFKNVYATEFSRRDFLNIAKNGIETFNLKLNKMKKLNLEVLIIFCGYFIETTLPWPLLLFMRDIYQAFHLP